MSTKNDGSRKFCETHKTTKVRRTDGFTRTHIGCWRCKLDNLWDAPAEKEDSALKEVNVTIASLRGKEAREEALNELMKELFKKQESGRKEHARLVKRVEELTSDNQAVGSKWQEATKRVQELTDQLDKNMEMLDETENEKDEAEAKVGELEARIGQLEVQVVQLEKEREAMRTEAQGYINHINALEAQLQAVIEQEKLPIKVPSSPVRADAPSTRFFERPSTAAPISRGGKQATPRSAEQQQHSAPADASNFEPTAADSPSKLTKTDSRKGPLGGLLRSLSTTKGNKAITEPTSPQQPLARAGSKEKVAAASSEPVIPKVTKSPNSTTKPVRDKISVICHMGGSDRVNFKMYCDQEFRQVMERYLKVKKIDAPVDEVKFVVDGVKHTLAPELTPTDFKLQDGATINVIVPEEYLQDADA